MTAACVLGSRRADLCPRPPAKLDQLGLALPLLSALISRPHPDPARMPLMMG